ncbi:hypothetical protein TIFTF001_012253 [Ficus carica]|uniref:RNase H type-1 domain-containing protein n=1 Tax=Ficus carica TaxID=3494 RepID=A0AA88ABZ4_FICCA|nr:hypothetical protein TIFTF001_012253 [Ficus carica]
MWGARRGCRSCSRACGSLVEQLHISSDQRLNTRGPFSSFCLHITPKDGLDDLEIWCYTVAWSIWLDRNKLVSNRKQNLDGSGAPSEPRMSTRWKPPNLGRQKINVDAAVKKSFGFVSVRVGVIIRDDQGLALAAAAMKLRS